MPLAHDQRLTIARVLRWSRSHGWVHDAYPNTWRSIDGLTHVRYDAVDGVLVVDRMMPDQDPLRCRVALIPIDSPDVAVDVLAALGHVPPELSPIGRGLLADLSIDDAVRATYRTLMPNGRHGYMSTYCQHGLHDDCKMSCKCCGSPCVCDRCLHTPPYTEPENALTLPVDGEPEPFDGPADFVDAGQALADWVDGRITPEQGADVLSKLAGAGLIISVAYHDEMCGGQADDELEQIIRENES